MSDVLFNNQGVPLLAYGKKSITSTFGAPRMNAISKNTPDEKPAVSEQIQDVEDTTDIGPDPIVNWGENNDFPTTANDIIRKVGVLNTGLKFIRNFTLGQGIFPCRVTGYDDRGNETLEVVDDEELIQFCQSRMVRRYLEKLLRDYLKFGVGNVELVPNEDGSQLVGINIREAFLVNIANSWIDRQNILDPLEAFLEFNGVEAIQLRFRSTILTTLDEGAGTEKILS